MANIVEDARTAARVWATQYWTTLQPTLTSSTFTNQANYDAMLTAAAAAINAEIALHSRWDAAANAAFVETANCHIANESGRVKFAVARGG